MAYCGTTWLGSPSWLKKPSPFKFYKLSMERSQGLLRFSHNILMTCWAACGDSSWPSSGNSGNSISMSSHQGDEMSTELLKVIINFMKPGLIHESCGIAWIFGVIHTLQKHDLSKLYPIAIKYSRKRLWNPTNCVTILGSWGLLSDNVGKTPKSCRWE